MTRGKWLSFLMLLVLLMVQLVPALLTGMLGEEIVLHAEVYDPRDVFRGDYVAIDFTAERASEEMFESVETERIRDLYGEKLFAQGAVRDGFWEIESVAFERPSEGTYIECTLDYYDERAGIVHLDFGVDRFYVEQNTGKAIEVAVRENRLDAQMKVWRGNLIMVDTIVSDPQK